ncbi:MAG: TRAP transporter small permease [Deltaproteobacteria bacterium]|nr:TRAP transporter small permease [Deltaproteobacteria bacterium]
MLQRLIFVSRRLNTVLMIIGGLLLSAMVLVSSANILLRAFWTPLKGTFEFMGFAGAVVAAMALAGTQQTRGHITVTLVPETISPVWNRTLIVVSNLLSLGLFSLVSWQVLNLALALKNMGELSETTHLPYYPVVGMVAVGFAVLVLTLIVETLAVVLPARERRP